MTAIDALRSEKLKGRFCDAGQLNRDET
jgi:hypothetical protein